MKVRLSAFVLTVGCAAAQSAAGVAVHSIAFGSPSGPNLVTLSPGQSTSVFVNIWWAPGPAPGGPLGLADGAFSITGSGSGSGTWSVDTNTASPTYSLPSPWGLQLCGCSGWPGYGTPSGNSINWIVWGFGFLFSNQHPAPDDPANVWRATFKALSPGEVLFTFSELSPTTVFVTGLPYPVPVSYFSTGFGAKIIVVPVPGSVLLLGAAAWVARRRARVTTR